ncbi:Dihydrolipoyllysine-residue acetyltransferase component of pyruvate dehydrogenase complex [Moraxella atlantae]|uniref:Dihydrolipoamide acetyltransferase component of pyruvate dehydrogenase complex n=1 Tax=Faucicola atlantae TaxID=34059 RepID=A0A378Q3Y4_9GAMM|nr:2-oxo acid dehydrogenase subunit E2 [Moraxella atlantae]STY95500.1 Dihydrolipoyllysine-residue acetyltransferase component of pyruvate dehydrogenase complex [Moraxella atlantae]
MQIKVPDLGVDSAEVSEIMVKVGDTIAKDDNIVLLESDKASVEVPASAAGKISHIAVKVGDSVKEGDVLLEVEDAAGENDSSAGNAADDAQPQKADNDTQNSADQNQQSTQTQPAQPAAQAQAQSSQGSEQTYQLPDLGVETADVAEWLVKEGDSVEKDQPLVLVESDKASVEVPAPAAGRIVKCLVQAGDSVSNGQDFVVIAGASSDAAQKTAPQKTADNTQTTQPTASQPANNQPAAQAQAQSSQGGKQTYQLPDLGVETADVAEWLVKEGDSVEKDQPLVLVESDKASVEVPAPAAGRIVKCLVQAGDSVSNGQDFVVIAGTEQTSQPAAAAQPQTAQKTTEIEPPKQAASSQPTQTAASSNPTQSQSQLSEAELNAKSANVYAGPAVRKLTRQLGVDINQVKGSGKHGRIIKDDVFAYVKTQMQGVKNAPSASGTTPTAARGGLPALPDMSKAEIWGDIERQDLSRLQKVSIPQLNYNTYLPQVTQFDLSDITDTEQLRVSLKEDFKKQGVSLTILAFIMKATAYALQQFPKFNSHLSDDNTQILVRKSVHMGFAVATDDGLTVPVIQNVQNKGIKQIAIEIGELAKKARDKKLTAKELTGASFTISSQGNLGGTYFTPLVNWPQVAILGVSEASMQPRWNADSQSFEPRLMLPLSLSYDHRVINGADAAVFTRYVANLLADPRRILF